VHARASSACYLRRRGREGKEGEGDRLRSNSAEAAFFPRPAQPHLWRGGKKVLFGWGDLTVSAPYARKKKREGKGASHPRPLQLERFLQALVLSGGRREKRHQSATLAAKRPTRYDPLSVATPHLRWPGEERRRREGLSDRVIVARGRLLTPALPACLLHPMAKKEKEKGGRGR